MLVHESSFRRVLSESIFGPETIIEPVDKVDHGISFPSLCALSFLVTRLFWVILSLFPVMYEKTVFKIDLVE